MSAMHRSRRSRWKRLGAVWAVAAASFLSVARLAYPATKLPTAEVKRGDFVEALPLRGEVKAVKSTVLEAPSGAGDLRIVRLAPNGAMVKAGEVVVEFDATDLRKTLDQKRSDLKEAEAEIEQARAQARLTEEQDTTDLAKARYDVERARLEASKQEILSKLEGEENKLKLAAAEQHLKQAEEKLQADQAGDKATISAKVQKRDKVQYDVREAEMHIARMSLRASKSGLITILTNWQSQFSGGSPMPFKPGDSAWPGATIAELPDMSSFRVTAPLDEADRGRVKAGQEVTVRVDAVPDKELRAHVADISTLAKQDFSTWPPPKNFELTVQLEQTDSRLRPGMSATVRVAVAHLPNSLLIPAEAAFEKAGKTVVYVQKGSGFEERAIEVARRGECEVAVAAGLKAGERVALKEPGEEGAP